MLWSTLQDNLDPTSSTSTRSKKLLEAPGIATRSDRTLLGLLALLLGAMLATRSTGHRYPFRSGSPQFMDEHIGACSVWCASSIQTPRRMCLFCRWCNDAQRGLVFAMGASAFFHVACHQSRGLPPHHGSLKPFCSKSVGPLVARSIGIVQQCVAMASNLVASCS